MPLLIIIISLMIFMVGLKVRYSKYLHLLIYGTPMFFIIIMLKDMEINLCERIIGGFTFLLILIALWVFPNKNL
ncbi:hypothetical protein PSOS111911_04580 [Pseudoalteromonas ostreae]